MRKLLVACLAMALAALPARAQNPSFPQILPQNTVIGYIGAGAAGPAAAIPIGTLVAQFPATVGTFINAMALTGHTIVTNPGDNGFWGLLIQATTVQNAAVENGLTIDINATQSCTLSLSNGGCNKVAFYSGIQCATGNTACWAGNPIINIGVPSSNFQSGLSFEIDYNNQANTNFGTYTGAWNNASTGAGCPGSAGGGGTFNCYTVGLLVTGQGGQVGGGTVDAAVVIAGTGPAGFNNSFWNRGFVASGGIYQHAFEDSSNAPTAYVIYGSKTYGLDLAGGGAGAGYSGLGIRFPNTTAFGWRNAANNADVSVIQYNDPTLTFVPNSGGFINLQGSIKTNQTAANGSVATAMSSLGPAAAHTTIQEWLQISDNSGNLRFIPMF